jgi:hypothetical protein
LFSEEQSFRIWWLWLLILLVTGAQWWAFVQQIILGEPFGNNPGPDRMIWLFTALFGIGLPLFFYYMRLVTEVRGGILRVRFPPFRGKTIPLETIAASGVVTYSPLRDYGGWGMRLSKHGRAYNAYGNRGVQLLLENGDRILVGSQRAEELQLAISTGAARISP